MFLSFVAPIDSRAAPGQQADAAEVAEEGHRNASPRKAWKSHGSRHHRKVYRRKGELLVQHRGGVEAAIDDAPAVGRFVRGSRTRSSDRLTLRFDEDAVDFESLKSRVEALPGVAHVEANIIIETQARAAIRGPAPDYSRKQWHWRRSGSRERLLRREARRAGELHATVCVLDTGLDFEHPELEGRVVEGVNVISEPGPDEPSDTEMDFNGHGTRVAGVIASGDDGIGTVGVNPLARVCGIKAFDRDGIGTLEDVIRGIDWAIENDVAVLNMSFGTYEESLLLEEAIRRAAQAGLLLVASAGNDAAEVAMAPGRFPEVIAVGGHDERGWISSFSNWGGDVDLYAPGERVLTTDLSNGRDDPYVVLHGTSAAAAFVSGLASLLLDAGHGPGAASSILLRDVIRKVEDRVPGGIRFDQVNSRSIIARLLGEPYSALTLTRFETIRSVLGPDQPLNLVARLQNSGTQESAATDLWLDVADAEYEDAIRATKLVHVPALAPGASFEIVRSPPMSDVAPALDLEDRGAVRLALEISLGNDRESPLHAQHVLVTTRERASLKVRRLWASPLDFRDPEAERTLHTVVENDGNLPMRDLRLRAYAVAALHEGVGQVPKIDLGSIPIPDLSPGEVTQVRLPLHEFSPPEHHVTFWVEVEADGKLQTRFLKGYRYPGDGGTVSPQFVQYVHRAVVDEAVKLLAAEGVYIEDLHAPGSIYRGNPLFYNEWPGTVGLPTAEWTLSGWWTDARLVSGPVSLALSDFTLIDGAHDADGVDIAFGYSFEDVFDSHFWIVDNYDDDGLDSAGSNHHSALSKLRALLYGRDGGAPSDSRLDHGAIEHYRAGYKKAAWWFVGHAAHLIGDISVPSHVDNENYHGVSGATYHGWMDSGEYARWSYVDAYTLGGTIDPYVPESLGDPLRYLAYSTAQVGNSFPWAETIGTQGGGDGNRVAGGDYPRYTATVHGLFAQMAPRPLVKWHVNKDEVYDNFWGECQLVDWVGPFESRRDCWGGGDGHVDYDNTDDGGSNADGDMKRIGDFNYPYAIRAIAGLIYYFAMETNQIGPCSGQDAPLGDANGDGLVDGADYTLWADNFGASPAAVSEGDFNCDDRVDGADYTIWADNFGVGADGGAAAAVESAPEIACGVGFEIIGLLGIVIVARKRRLRHARLG